MRLQQKLARFRDLAYETGWMSAQIEVYVASDGVAGALYDEQTQREKIDERNRLQSELVDALRQAEG